MEANNSESVIGGEQDQQQQLMAIKEEAETSADSMTIDVEGHDETAETKLKAEAPDPMEQKAWINALRTHVVVPLTRYNSVLNGYEKSFLNYAIFQASKVDLVQKASGPCRSRDLPCLQPDHQNSNGFGHGQAQD